MRGGGKGIEGGCRIGWSDIVLSYNFLKRACAAKFSLTENHREIKFEIKVCKIFFIFQKCANPFFYHYKRIFL